MTPKLKTFLERGFSTIVLLSLLGGAVAWNNPIGYAVLVCLLCNLTSWEWFNMLRGTQANRWLSLVAGIVYASSPPRFAKKILMKSEKECTSGT